MNRPEPSSYHQPYAPSPYSYTPNPSLLSHVSLDEEIKLSATPQQRELNESLAEIFAIIVALDYVEKAFVKDSISQEEYTITCSRLLGQYKTILKNPTVAAAFVDLDTFKREYDISYPSATSRLSVGIPATLEQPLPAGSGTTTTASIASGGGTSDTTTNPTPASTSTSANPSAQHQQQGLQPTARAAAEATQHFITFLDALRLNYAAKDQLHPLLSDVITAVNNVTQTDFEGRACIVKWLIVLNRMGAGDEIDEQQRRQMLFDVEGAYHEFYKTLG